jgi:O-acetyl-ADP-ribose deacetylase (regulator of RNase III)
MKIEYNSRDLLQSSELIVVHGCNARGGFASGVAGAIRAAWPFAYRVYAETHIKHGLELGQIVWAIDVVKGQPASSKCPCRIVGNMITQANYGRSGNKFVDDDAVWIGMTRLNAAIPFLREAYGPVVERVAMPKIGAGLGGGSWPELAALIEAAATNFQPVVYTNGR